MQKRHELEYRREAIEQLKNSDPEDPDLKLRVQQAIASVKEDMSHEDFEVLEIPELLQEVFSEKPRAPVDWSLLEMEKMQKIIEKQIFLKSN